MNKLMLVNKPKGLTSHDVVDFVRKKLNIKKVGHGGTLDPEATGLLILGLGKATKRLGLISALDKEYIADIRLGVVTDTQDKWGTVLSEKKDVNVSYEEFEKVCNSFVGKIKQIPPMYSAKKINGKRLYKLARKGITVERDPVEIEIYSIDIIKFDGCCGSLKVRCSSGTYIRTLYHDIGEKLGIGGVMEDLERTAVGDYLIKDAEELNL